MSIGIIWDTVWNIFWNIVWNTSWWGSIRSVAQRASLPVLVIGWSSLGFGQANDAPASMRKNANAANTFVAGRAGSGIGVFQDIQVPMNDSGRRADGTTVQTENADHVGFPLWAGLGIIHYGDRANWVLDAGVDVMQMRASTGPAETQSSSYARLDLGLGGAYKFSLGGSSLALGVRVSGRRSAFNNVSNGHFIEAMITRGTLGWAFGKSSLQAYGAVAPATRFGYSREGGFGFSGSDFKQAKAAVSEQGVAAAFHLRDRVWLDLSFERESAQITLDDVETEYNSFGLTVTRQELSRRVYELATSVVRFGVRKEM